jgi:hypothetical protein
MRVMKEEELDQRKNNNLVEKQEKGMRGENERLSVRRTEVRLRWVAFQSWFRE